MLSDCAIAMSYPAVRKKQFKLHSKVNAPSFLQNYNSSGRLTTGRAEYCLLLLSRMMLKKCSASVLKIWTTIRKKTMKEFCYWEDRMPMKLDVSNHLHLEVTQLARGRDQEVLEHRVCGGGHDLPWEFRTPGESIFLIV